jgi:cell wall-associated NlpC family hydrolase
VDAGLDVAAELAADQYQNGNLSAYGQLLLTKDPYQAVHMGELLAAAGRSQVAFVNDLKTEQANLQQLKDQSSAALATAKTLLAQQDQNKTDIARQLATVEQLVSSLTGVQQTALEQLEAQQENDAQLAFLASGALGHGERAPSAAGRQAVAFALAQLGKPYLWGGTGPGAYDCSGLTSQAWLHAGVQIPRTSEDQWAGLQHVALDQLRPGDLVVYYASAEHIAMYIGGGFVVQAPHTGAVVRISPIGMAPILGAVRPDPQSGSDGGGWQVPAAVKDAGTITPIAPGAPAPGLPPAAPLPAGPVAPVTPPAPAAGGVTVSGAPSGDGPGPKPGSGSSPTQAPSGAPSGGPSGAPSGSGSPAPSGSGSGSGSGSPSASGAPSAAPTGSASPTASAAAGTPGASATSTP